MSSINLGGDLPAEGREGRGLRRTARWICLAATPVFATLALVTGLDDPAAHGHRGSPLGGMPLMYALMAVLHAAPWLLLASRRFSDIR